MSTRICIHTKELLYPLFRISIKIPSRIFTSSRAANDLQQLKPSLCSAVRHKEQKPVLHLHPHWKPKNPVNSGHLLLCVMLQPTVFTLVPFFNLLEKPHRYVFLLFQGCSYYPTSELLVILIMRIHTTAVHTYSR